MRGSAGDGTGTGRRHRRAVRNGAPVGAHGAGADETFKWRRPHSDRSLRRSQHRAGRYGTLLAAGSLAAGVVAWMAISPFVSPLILPPVSDVIDTLIDILTTPAEWDAIATTAIRLITSWVLGAMLGVTVGLAMGLAPLVETLAKPYVVLMQSVPRISWILLAMFWFGINGSVVVFLIVVTVAPFFIVNVSQAVRDIRSDRREVMEVFQLPLLVRLWDVYLPAISLALRSAASVSLSVGWKAVVMAELLAAPDGIGARLSWAQGSFDTTTVFAWTIIIASAALASHAVLERVRS